MVSNYSKEASLNNPCLNMPFIKTPSSLLLHASRTLSRVFTLGFLFTWITERGVEYGFDVYEIENGTSAVALVLGKAEAMIFYQSYRRKRFGAGGGAGGEKAGDKKEKRAPGMSVRGDAEIKNHREGKMEEITAENIG